MAPRARPAPPLGFVLRRATLADTDLLVRHRLAMFREMGDRPEPAIVRHGCAYLAWMVPRVASGEMVAWVAEGTDGRSLGSGAVWFQPTHPRPGIDDLRVPYVLSVYTTPRARGRGVATAVVRRAIALAKRLGYARVTLHASAMGRGVYERVGFHPTTELRLPGSTRSSAGARQRGGRPKRPPGGRSGPGRHRSGRRDVPFERVGEHDPAEQGGVADVREVRRAGEGLARHVREGIGDRRRDPDEVGRAQFAVGDERGEVDPAHEGRVEVDPLEGGELVRPLERAVVERLASLGRQPVEPPGSRDEPLGELPGRVLRDLRPEPLRVRVELDASAPDLGPLLDRSATRPAPARGRSRSGRARGAGR